MACKERYIIYVYMNCALLDCVIVYCKLVQPTELDIL